VPVDDPAHPEEARRLEALCQRLGILIRELKSRQHLLSAQQQILWTMARDRRYPRSASLDQRQKNVGDLLQTAAEVQKILEGLIRNSGLLSEGEIAKGIGETITQLFEQSHHPGISVPGSAYIPLAPGQFNATPEAATLAVFIALHAWLRLRRRSIKSTAA